MNTTQQIDSQALLEKIRTKYQCYLVEVSKGTHENKTYLEALSEIALELGLVENELELLDE